jgi:hypothetical protein
MKLQVIIEKGNEVLYGRIEGGKLFTPTTAADTKTKVLANLKMLILDYQKNEGADDKYWNKVDVGTAEFEFYYDLRSFFEEYDWITVSAIARHIGMSESLVRQYATGKKFPSHEQAQKIQAEIRELAKPLQKISLYA